ncbi:uncharacterized protein LOC142321283 [Lycorma delicatula]|uniref:uncharacterized protein LOC142321283 n=1 Tax=Lycorma delicatula TaxID=130591 RepID=UPI003F515770
MIGDKHLESKITVKYLGVVIDKASRFSEHVLASCNKAENTLVALRCFMTSQVEPKSSKRKLIITTLMSALLYAVLVWGKALEKRRNLQRMHSIHCKVLLGVIFLFHTTSSEAACVLATVPPVDLLVWECTNRFASMNKTKASLTAMNTWSESEEMDSKMNGLEGSDGLVLI